MYFCSLFFLINFDPILILYRIESWLQVAFSAFKFETHTPTVFFKVWFLLSFVFFFWLNMNN